MSSTVVGLANVVLGLVYMQYGTMTLLDMRRARREFGFSHFGAAWILMAFTCGPHHFTHGLHVIAEGRIGGPLDMIVTLVAAPAGITWFLLRVEAYRGGSGDRFIAGTPLWVALLPAGAAAIVAGVGVEVVHFRGWDSSLLWIAIPNLLLIGLYVAIGVLLLRTQLENRNPMGGWSLSGLSLGFVFPSCAVMHGIFAAYTLTGRYEYDVHGFAIAWLSVPAAIYFLAVVWRLRRMTLRDWNTVAETTPARSPVAVSA